MPPKLMTACFARNPFEVTFEMRAGTFLLILLALMALPRTTVLFADDEDPFGDPFAVHDGEVEPLSSAPVFAVSGEIVYQPILFLDWQDDAYGDPVYLSNAVSGDIGLYGAFGRSSFVADFRTRVIAVAGGTPEFEIDIRELYFNYRSNFVDIEVGFFPLEWSVMNVFKIADFFQPAALPFLTGELLSSSRTGIHAIFYYGLFSLEGVYLPLYSAPASVGDYVGSSLGVDFYPQDIEVVQIDEKPDPTYDHFQAAGRFGMALGALDLYLLGYHGYSNQEIHTSQTVFEPPASSSLLVEREYNIVDTLGLSASFELLGFVVGAEATVTFEAPVLVDEVVELLQPVGTVTNKVLARVPVLAWSAGFDWGFLPNTRLLFEYSDLHVLEELDSLDETALAGDTFFAALAIIIPARFELDFFLGSIYDWSGHELTLIGTVGIDFLNGITVDMSAIYFEVLEATVATSALYEHLERDIILDLSLRYTF